MNRLTLSSLILTLFAAPLAAADGLPPEEAARALRKAVEFFRTQVSAEGGYLWRYSADLSQREGEGAASATTAWVQPPGTPSVGEAFLNAWELTGDDYYRQAARETAMALVRGQLRSGGWDYRIEFAPPARQRYAYRVEPQRDKQRNESTLDDDTTQSAVRFLLQVDRALDFQDEAIHEAVTHALDCLRKVQYPNGAWPQRFSELERTGEFPVKRASYPETWSRTFPGADYRAHYTFNDNAIADMVRTMVEAAEILKNPQYLDAARKAGGFVLLAQMPDPQPAWAQQYDLNMQPAWARRFEPPSVTGGESQGVLRLLMYLYRKTGDRRYLEPIPRALAYLRASQLPDGRLARFYELQTNKPLYFTKEYELTYSRDDMPTHYAFIVGASLDSIANEYERMLKLDPAELDPPRRESPPRLTPALTSQARAVITQMDPRGAWLEKGSLRTAKPGEGGDQVIDCRTFIKNVGILSRYVAAAKRAP